MPKDIIEIEDSLPHFEFASENVDTLVVDESVIEDAARQNSNKRDPLMERFEENTGLEAEEVKTAPRLC